MRKWEGFFVAFLICTIVACVLFVWAFQLVGLEDRLSGVAYMIQAVSFLLAGFSFGLIPAIPVIYEFEKAGKA